MNLLNKPHSDQVNQPAGIFFKFTVDADRCSDTRMGRMAIERTALSP